MSYLSQAELKEYMKQGRIPFAYLLDLNRGNTYCTKCSLLLPGGAKFCFNCNGTDITALPSIEKDPKTYVVYRSAVLFRLIDGIIRAGYVPPGLENWVLDFTYKRQKIKVNKPLCKKVKEYFDGLSN